MGIAMGAGNHWVDCPDGKSSVPSAEGIVSFFELGCTYNYQALHAPLAFKSSLFYCYRKSSFSSHYLRLPVGVDLMVGKRFAFVAGAGFYFAYMIAHSDLPDDIELEESVLRSHLGGYLNAGVKFPLSSKGAVSILFHSDSDLTEIYSVEDFSPGGARFFDPCFGKEYYPEFRITKKIFADNKDN